jgi:GTP-binding protein EngB required for normal cell division
VPTVILKKVGKEAELVSVNSVDDIGKLVGGYLVIADEIDGVTIYADEDGKPKELADNYLSTFYRYPIVGTVVAAKVDSVGNIEDLTGPEQDNILGFFNLNSV